VKALILQTSRAFGDRLFISWVPKKLKRKLGYDQVDLATWENNEFVTANNPFIDNIVHLEDHGKKSFIDLLGEWQQEYDKVFDFRYHVEGQYLKFNTNKNDSSDILRENAKDVNYYNCYQDFGLENESCRPDVYLSDKEKETVKGYKKQGKKRILWQLQGSARNKQISYMPAYINYVAQKYPDIENWICGDKKDSISALTENVIDVRGNDQREMLSLIPIFNLVVGPESFCVNAAGAFDVPTLTFYSHSAPHNLTGKFKSAYWILPECDCSPCYTIMRDFRPLLKLDERVNAMNQEKKCSYREDDDLYRVLGYRCCIQIDHKKVVEKLETFIKGWS